MHLPTSKILKKWIPLSQTIFLEGSFVWSKSIESLWNVGNMPHIHTYATSILVSIYNPYAFFVNKTTPIQHMCHFLRCILPAAKNSKPHHKPSQVASRLGQRSRHNTERPKRSCQLLLDPKLHILPHGQHPVRFFLRIKQTSGKYYIIWILLLYMFLVQWLKDTHQFIYR